MACVTETVLPPLEGIAADVAGRLAASVTRPGQRTYLNPLTGERETIEAKTERIIRREREMARPWKPTPYADKH